MERSDDKSDGDGLQSRLSPEASPHQSRLRRRRHLLQSLPRRRPGPHHQAPPATSPDLGERGRRHHHHRRPRSLREAPGRGCSEIRRIARSSAHRRTRKHHKYHHPLLFLFTIISLPISVLVAAIEVCNSSDLQSKALIISDFCFLQRCLSCTWKSCERNKKRSRSATRTSNFWKL